MVCWYGIWLGENMGGIHRTAHSSTVPSNLQKDKGDDCRGIGQTPSGGEGFGIRDQYTCSRMDMAMDVNKVVGATCGQGRLWVCHSCCSIEEVE